MKNFFCLIGLHKYGVKKRIPVGNDVLIRKTCKKCNKRVEYVNKF